MQHFDMIITGAGLAGLSLATHLVTSPLQNLSILLIDRSAKDKNDRTWGFWSNKFGIFDHLAVKSWDQFRFTSQSADKVIQLKDYRYKVIAGIDLYRNVQNMLAKQGNVKQITGTVRNIEDGADRVLVQTNDTVYSGTWLFNSMHKRSDFHIQPDCHHCLNLHFLGWEIETKEPFFDPNTPTFMDFRTPQGNETRFFYILPYSRHHALIEYTLFTRNRYQKGHYTRAMLSYLDRVMKIGEFNIHRNEIGSIPITDRGFPRRVGHRVINIGALGGMIKPSTGYAFTRIQQDSAAIVQSMLSQGDPFKVPGYSQRYRLYDRMILNIICNHGERIQTIFSDLFSRNPIERIFRFLDEQGSLQENIQLIYSLPHPIFLRSLFTRRVIRGFRPILTEHFSSYKKS